jgi:cell division septal protein FtsQ
MAITSSVVLVVAVLFCWGIVALSRLDALQITQVEVHGNRMVPSDQITAVANTDLDGFAAYFIPNRNMFIYPSARIAAELYAKFPQIDVARLVRRSGTLSIEIHERVPSAVVCAQHVDDCVLVDDTAFGYTPAPTASERVYVVFNIGATSSPLIANYALDSKQFTALKALAEDVSKIGIPISKVELGNDSDISLIGQTGTIIRIKQANSYDQSFNNLSLFLDKFDQQTKPRKARNSFQQIDLRYGNSVFYK